MNSFVAFCASVVGGWIVLNLIGAFFVGWLARKIFPARNKVGWFMTLVIGFFGGILGKLVFWILRWPSGFPMGLVASVLGAFVLLLVYYIRMSLKAPKPA